MQRKFFLYIFMIMHCDSVVIGGQDVIGDNVHNQSDIEHNCSAPLHDHVLQEITLACEQIAKSLEISFLKRSAHWDDDFINFCEKFWEESP